MQCWWSAQRAIITETRIISILYKKISLNKEDIEKLVLKGLGMNGDSACLDWDFIEKYVDPHYDNQSTQASCSLTVTFEE